MKTLFTQLPEWAKKPLRQLRSTLYHGSARFCPVCQRSSRQFLDGGIVPRADAQCAHCGAFERHRLLWIYLSEHTNLFDGRKKEMLHVAPEKCFESRFREKIGSGYLTADLLDPNVMVQMDITNIQYPDQSFDVIYCSHVLEHVPDDKKAMREFQRVLKSDGWAILQVPITSEKTIEDPSITDPAERLALFGQEDHVRRYGPDYAERLRETGFSVDVIEITDLVDAETATQMGLTEASGEIYFCRK